MNDLIINSLVKLALLSPCGRFEPANLAHLDCVVRAKSSHYNLRCHVDIRRPYIHIGRSAPHIVILNTLLL